MRIKIQGGTLDHGQATLCHTCRHATIVKGRTLGEEIVSCGRLTEHQRVPFTVTSCSGYSDRRLPSLADMEDIAWVLRSDAKRKQVGFVRAADVRPWRRALEDD